MIRVNLLPDEYRPKEGASWAVLLTAMFVAAAVVLLIVGVGVVKLKEVGLRGDLALKEADAELKKKKAEVHDQLEEEIAAARNREKTIKGIAESKVNWARELDLLTDLILEGQMWLEELELLDSPKAKPGQGKKRVVAPRLRLMAYFVGEQPRLMNEFYTQLESSRAFFNIFDPEGTSRPQWERKNISEVYGVPFIEDHELNLLSVFELNMKSKEKDEPSKGKGAGKDGKKKDGNQ